MVDDKDEFEAKLEAIRTSYVSEALPVQLQAVKSGSDVINSAGVGSAGVEALSVLHAASHKLAGSSGTFGLGELSVAARKLSDFTDGKNGFEESNSDHFLEQINAMVDAVLEVSGISNQIV